ncbi:MAG: NADH-quinone oxidoreductase subunit A [Bacteroidetes bacterium]|nr:NADH-quinone oxidoreductase subunit A [Bacteroidota bacterium]
MLSQFGIVLLFFIVAALFVAAAMFGARLLRPARPSAEKLSTYECGEEPIGDTWVKFNVRFYIVALIFLIFDVEVVFLFPWALVYQKLGMFAFVEMMIFLAILVAGYVYVWVKGDLDWDKPRPRYIDYVRNMVAETLLAEGGEPRQTHVVGTEVK